MKTTQQIHSEIQDELVKPKINRKKVSELVSEIIIAAQSEMAESISDKLFNNAGVENGK